ncbi:magnesium chelatase [Parafrankia sp. FMc2]|uniref:magnesium chelatase n=1 Tax=Parafrankia sp. FMc2 TaxID=3233196 RepID=UPI0034D39DAE
MADPPAPHSPSTPPTHQTAAGAAVPATADPPASGPPPTVITLADLRRSGHVHRSVRAELRGNLLARMRSDEDRFPGIVGFDDTVLPQVERALLAGHDIVFLGERGQGKTRLIRTLVGLLDEWSPSVAGCEINDHPYAPVCGRCRLLLAEVGEKLPITWRHRSERFGEKLATPDTSVGDLIGDVDPVKVAEGRTLGDPETVHYGLVPRTNRGIFSVNELPDLAERIQVALLNVLEERDIQVRGYMLRLPLDLLLVASANPEDYTNRGRIITPLKDRFGAEVRTHYPLRLDDELRLIRQEAVISWAGSPLGTPELPDHLIEVVARFTRLVREAPQVDQRSGVSARLAVAAAETVAASAVRRAALTGEETATARVVDLAAIVPAVRGKVEFDQLEEGREDDVLALLLRRAIAETFRAKLAGSDLSGLQERFERDGAVETGDLVPATELLRRIGPVPGLAAILNRLDVDGAESPGLAAAALELAMEGLHLNRRLAKEELPGRTVYGG